MPAFQPQEIQALRVYLSATFRNDSFELKIREKATDSLEVLLNGEFIGTIYKDEDDGDISYDFNMAILGMDLPKVA